MKIKIEFSEAFTDCLELIGLCDDLIMDKFTSETKAFYGCEIDKGPLCIGCLTESMETTYEYKTKV